MTRVRRSFFSLLANYVFTGSTLVIGLVVTPLLFDWLGDDRVGLYRVGMQWIGYSALLTGWVDGALMVHFARAFAAGDRTAVLRIARTGFRAFAVIGFFGLLWLAMLAAFAPSLFNLDDPRFPPERVEGYLREIRLGLLLYGLISLLTAFSVFRTLTDSEQRGYIAYLAVSAGTILGAGASLAFAACGAGLSGQFAAFALSGALPVVFLTVGGLRRYPELLRRGDGTAINWRQAFDGPMLLLHFGIRMAFQSDAIIIALVLGSTFVAAFNTTQSLFMMLQSAVMAIGAATRAAMANLHHGGQHEAFARRMVQLTRAVIPSSIAVTVPAAVWNHAFVLNWVVEERRYAGDALSAFTAGTVILHGIHVLWGNSLMSTGHVRQALQYYLVGLAANIIVSLCATAAFGPIGPPMGTITNILLLLFGGLPRLMERELHTPRRELLRAVLMPLPLIIPYAAALIALESMLGLTAWRPGRLPGMFAIGVLIVACGAVFLLVALFVAVPADDRRELRFRLRNRRAPAAESATPPSPDRDPSL